MAEKLPHEIIIEILSRLPAKTLITFRCVSKPWRSLTYDTNFIKMHLTRALERDDLNLFVTETSLNHKKVELKGLDDDGNEVESRLVSGFECHTHLYCIDGTLFDKLVELRNPLGMTFTNLFGPPFDDSKVMGTCNGIVCLARRNIVLLLNPTTREFKVVRFGEEFDFDYHQNNGFGYDGSTDDYVLVKFINGNGCESSINVYSVNNTSCSTVSDVPYTITDDKALGIFLNGAFYWLAHGKGKYANAIISFDIEQKAFREVQTPVCMRKLAEVTIGVTIGKLRGKLCMYCKYYDETGIEIWVMEDYGPRVSWFKLLAIPEAGYRRQSYDLAIHYKLNSVPICFAKNDEVVLMDKSNLVFYDLKQKTGRRLEIHNNLDWSKIDRLVTPVASLVSLKSGTYVGNAVSVEGEEQV